MKDIDNYIQEKLRINKDTKVVKQEYTCQPKDRKELRKILKERLAQDNNANLNDIDVSQITDMSYLFQDLYPHNIKIDKWDVSNAKDMRCMFDGCVNFEGKGLENWDVSNVENMNFMFVNCRKFNCDLSKWNITKAKHMAFAMFDGCKSLKNKPSWYKN